MKTSGAMTWQARRRSVVAAVVLGTALSALGSAAVAANPTSQATIQTVNDISRYCAACWRNARLHPDCWTDCTQDVFTRLLERVAPNEWDRVLLADGDERREFLRAIDAVKKRTQRRHKCATLLEDAVADQRTMSDGRAADRAAVEQVAAELLSPRQQRILQMSFEGWAVPEIARVLLTTPERVSDEKYKAIRKLREHLCLEENG